MAGSCCWTSGPSAASTACTCSTSCGRSRRGTPTSWSSIGVHSPKFVHEADPDALAAAVERYEVHHPVLDDPDLATWGLRGPRLADPGAGRPRGLRRRAVRRRGPRARDRRPARRAGAEHRDRGHPAAGGLAVRPAGAAESPRCASRPRWSSWPDGQLPGRRRRPPPARRARRDGGPCVRRIGHGERGLVDGDHRRAFTEPNGLCLLPPTSPPRSGTTCVVADTVNHALRAVRPGRRGGRARSPATAGSGCRATAPSRLCRPVGRGLVAGPRVGRDGGHPPAVDVRPAHRRRRGRWPAPRTRACATGRCRGVVRAAVRAGGRTATGSGWRTARPVAALRAASSRRARVGTAVGAGLFDFGLRDGPAAEAMLQHPLGVTVLPDGAVAVSDTYNGAVRRYDPATGLVTTLAAGLAEPPTPSSTATSWWWSSPPRTGWCGCRSARRRRSTGSPSHPAAGHRGRRRRARARRRVRAAARAEGRRPVGPPTQLVVGHPAGAAARRRRARHRPDAARSCSTRRWGTACCTWRRVRRPATWTPRRGLPRAPAGLGRAGAGAPPTGPRLVLVPRGLRALDPLDAVAARAACTGAPSPAWSAERVAALRRPSALRTVAVGSASAAPAEARPPLTAVQPPGVRPLARDRRQAYERYAPSDVSDRGASSSCVGARALLVHHSASTMAMAPTMMKIQPSVSVAPPRAVDLDRRSTRSPRRRSGRWRRPSHHVADVLYSGAMRRPSLQCSCVIAGAVTSVVPGAGMS